MREAFVLRHARIVEIGGLHPAIVLLERVRSPSRRAPPAPVDGRRARARRHAPR
jgi:hypothetical protein